MNFKEKSISFREHLQVEYFKNSIKLVKKLTRLLFNPRINLSPFTKDFRGEEQLMSLIDEFLKRSGSATRPPITNEKKNLSCCIANDMDTELEYHGEEQLI